MKKQQKKAYMCGVDWDHELGETDVRVFPPNSLKPFQGHRSCGVYEVTISLSKVVKSPRPYPKNKQSPIANTKKMIQQVEQEITQKQKFLKKLKKELKSLSKK